MKLNTIIELPDGRIGTICYNGLDGKGGCWGEHHFTMPDDCQTGLPKPDFMLRDDYEGSESGAEYVGNNFKIINYGI